MSVIPIHTDKLQELINKIDELKATVASLERRMGKTRYTQADFARECGVTVTTIWRWEKAGKITKLPDGSYSLEQIMEIKKQQ